jgi:hypothetical protein
MIAVTQVSAGTGTGCRPRLRSSAAKIRPCLSSSAPCRAIFGARPACEPGTSAAILPFSQSPAVIQTAARLGITPAQVALQWLLQLAPNALLIPGTGSVAHLRENLAAERVALDDQALHDLDSVAA